jgi:hypothetical protein
MAGTVDGAQADRKACGVLDRGVAGTKAAGRLPTLSRPVRAGQTVERGRGRPRWGGGLRSERTPGAGRVVPVPCHLAPQARRLPRARSADRADRWRGLGFARRGQANPVLIRHVPGQHQPSDLSLTVQGPNLARSLERLPGVRHVEAALLSLNAFPLTRRARRSSRTRLPPARQPRSAASTASTSTRTGSR